MELLQEMPAVVNPKFQDIRQVEDMKLIIDWDLRHQIAFVFEIDTEIARAHIPRETRLQPYEVRPGVSLMFLGYNDYNPGNLIAGEAQPAFKEITRVFMVQPNLSLSMPIPRFTFYVHRIASNNLAFNRQEEAMLHLPTYYSPSMQADTDEAKTSLRVYDDHGPIRNLLNTHPNPTFQHDAFFGQYYTMEANKLYFGVWYWAGKVCVHQKKGKAGGEFDHPFLSDMKNTFGAEAIGDCYMQLITAYGEKLVQRFYEPRLVREF